uniref:hypothetical protein n=1 Tax=Rheinheimera sp. TaxID=1869214 RepID=UPI0040475188
MIPAIVAVAVTTIMLFSASLTANYIDCGAGQPFDGLCGDFGAQDGELEFDQETLGNTGLDAESSEAINLGASWNPTDKAPPYASSPTNGYASSVHDWIGRLWTVRYSVRF